MGSCAEVPLLAHRPLSKSVTNLGKADSLLLRDCVQRQTAGNKGASQISNSLIDRTWISQNRTAGKVKAQLGGIVFRKINEIAWQIAHPSAQFCGKGGSVFGINGMNDGSVNACSA